VVADLENKKEVKASDRTLASVWPDAEPWVRSIIAKVWWLVEGEELWPDAGTSSIGVSGHMLEGNAVVRSDA
jgi:hypothetical protein